MNIVVKGRHLNVTPAIHDYATDKIGKVDKILEAMIMDIEVELFVERNPKIENSQVAEVTVRTKGHVIRAREAATDMYAALDLVSEKLERQARKLKGKVLDRHNGQKRAGLRQSEPEEAPSEERVIAKTKAVELKPMSTEEAILQMELLGHDFFLFTEEDSVAVNVLYRRKDGDYGLLQPRVG